MQRALAGQQAEQGLARLHGLALAHELGGDDARHGRSDGQAVVHAHLHFALLQLRHVTRVVGAGGGALAGQLAQGLFQLGKQAAGAGGLPQQGLRLRFVLENGGLLLLHADGAGGSGFFQALVAGQFFAGQAGLALAGLALAGGGFGFDLQQYAPGGLQLFVQAAGLLAQLLLLSVLRGFQAGFLLADLLLQRRAAVAAFRHGARGLDDGERLLGAGGVAFGRVQPLDDAGDRGRQRDHALQGHQLWPATLARRV